MQNTTAFLLETPNGKLETLCEYPVSPEKKPIEEKNIRGIGVVCHPHPLHGGTMNNKVVTTTASAFRTANIISVRFNFRGIGNSEGKYDNGRGEIHDALNVLQWARQQLPQRPLYLAGFSFGAYVALSAAMQISLPLAHLVLLAPAVKHADFTVLQSPCPWTIAIAENDTIALPQDIYQWAKTRSPLPYILSFPNASHFFDGQLVQLKQRLHTILC